jgi:hypothetical protein
MASDSVFRSLDAVDSEVCVEGHGRSVAKSGVEGWAGVVVKVDEGQGNGQLVGRAPGYKYLLVHVGKFGGQLEPSSSKVQMRVAGI